MELDAKEKVLVAIYTEYQKDLPNMDSITADALGLDHQVFNTVVDKLDNEGFIRGVHFTKADQKIAPIMVWMSGCKMTRFGIEYVESKYDIKQVASGEQKVKDIVKKSTEWGWDQFKDFGAKVLAEMMKG